ncbi:hypothetical protein B0T17DRAFT_496936 [Bombardia bombarda]|uniref:DUF3433 domain containing protein n=1 Tax=Bombardia bombarda TaxID=252184 RepID=A0AA39WI66_9PEZI|nr:hypothetical protein B0T17DRAFT_496936 [Bombardia bombarda]
MRAPVLTSVIVLSLAIAAVIEFLAQKTQRQGGLALTDTPDDMPSSVVFAYLYVPTIIAVLYGLVWTWIDFDVRRMQPWLELSRPGGAVAKNSLLLDYPFEFLAFIPFKAWKLKHWPVFCTGTVMMLVFWGVTPLQAAILGTQAIVLTSNMTMPTSSVLLPVQDQAARIDSSILNGAYAIGWFGQTFPAFTTADYAVLPISPASKPAPRDLWTIETTKLTTNLTCWPAIVTGNGTGYDMDNGQGCSTRVSFFQSSFGGNSSAIILYIGYYDNAVLDYYLEGPDCSKNSSDQFLAIYAFTAKGTADDSLKASDITALFCRPSYGKQDVSVSISSETSRPLDESTIELGPMETLDQTEFNSSAFEYLLGVGLPPATLATRDYAASYLPDPWPVLMDKNISWPTNIMVNYAVAFWNASTSDLKNQTILGHAFSAAHKALFSVAVSHLLSPASLSEVKQGTVQQTLYGVAVSRPIAAAVEGLLLLVAIITLTLLLTCSRALSKLPEDPASIGLTLKIMRSSQAILGRFASQGAADAKELRTRLSGEQYALLKDQAGDPDDKQLQDRFPGEQDTLLEDDAIGRDIPLISASASMRNLKYRPVQPVWLKPYVGVVLILILLGGLGVLAYFKKTEQVLNGLPLPSSDFAVLQLLENYVPTAFSTLLETVLVLLARLLCVLRPFRELHKGKASAKSTIEAKYTSIPPQFIIVRALKSRSFLLGAICFLAVLANGLAISLGGIFNEYPVTIPYPVTFRSSRVANLTRQTILHTEAQELGGSYTNHFFALWSNFSTNTSLPAWTVPHYAFFPLDVIDGGGVLGDNSTIFQAQVRGFGVKSACVPLSTSPKEKSFANVSLVPTGVQDPTYRYQHQNGSWATCTGQNFYGSKPFGRASHESITWLSPQEARVINQLYPLDGGFCGDKFILGWLRIDSDDTNRTFQSSFVQCEAAMQTAMFQVGFRRSGGIVSYERVGDFDDMTAFIPLNQSRALVREANSINSNACSPVLGIVCGWHNQTVTTDWFNYILKYYLNSTALVDPSQGVPNASLVIPAVQDVYQRLFAILLAQHMDMFQAAAVTNEAVADVSGLMMVEERRIFMNDAAFIISLVILSLDIVLLTVLYIRERKAFLPRLPSTIVSLIAYVAASRLAREYDGGEHDKRRRPKREEGLMKDHYLAPTYSFGKYLGIDGKPHIGIEVDPFVTPVDDSILQTSGFGFKGVGEWLRRRRRRRP